MLNLSEEELLFLVRNYYDVFIVAVFSIGLTFLVSKIAWRSLDMTTTSSRGGGIPGRLGLPFVGETVSLLSATSSIKGCYEFVRLRRIWHGKWFKTRIFGQIHVFVPSTEGARAIFSNDFAKFNKGYVKSMADCVGEKSLLCVPHEDHKRIRRLLSEPFSMNSLSTFVQKFDKVLCQELKKLEGGGKSFAVLDFSMKMTFDAMCNMLLSVTDDSLLRKIDKDCTAVSDAMLTFPYMIPGTRYYKGIKARRRLMETFKDIIGRRRSGKESAEDFLQSMLERDSCPPNEKLQDSEIMDNLLTLIIAGQTTTSAAMMWSVKFLDGNREAQERLRASFEIKKGWHVNIDATCIHNDPDLYAEPMQFNPSRFDEIQKPYSFIPFGSGPRTCLGMNMAKLTMLVFLHRLTSGYRWTVDDLDTSLARNAHIPRLRSGCPITLRAL
ncbi:hypothetical protein ACE6H2_024676 [Prunus campanulata]